jgi:hypothetical protein
VLVLKKLPIGLEKNTCTKIKNGIYNNGINQSVLNIVCRDSVAQMLSNEYIMSMNVICVIMFVKENSFGVFLIFLFCL